MTPAPDASFRLDGRIAFVSGAARNLGKAIAGALAGAGAHVILNGRGEAALADVAGELRGQGLRAETACFDMGDIAAVQEFFAGLGRLDVLVNCAIAMTPASFETLSEAAFAETYRSAVSGPFEAVRAALPALKAAVAAEGDASIVNISSMYGVAAPKPGLYSEPAKVSPAHYGPAKAAQLQLTRHLAAVLGRDQIRVNALVPGPFPNPSIRHSDPAFAARLADATMLGRLGEVAEIKGPLLFLASKASSFVTGISLPVDGGWTAW